ncbi:ankyrin repeat and protein kinase domain-containing protein 1 [Polypterus senegalus]|uniref:ankyrin repeat and protein kinase domain-containing protein 1 n=1 Tax=Polypterus senegalus TaxID=55291 RepID=UPI0019646C97|nr:ankyrin repeat and protein kinase domain-containing protein 1 [Polypterus senegalus]
MALPEGEQLRNLSCFKKDDFEPNWVKIAAGGFGQIYKVKHKLWRETFAVKSCSAVPCDTELFRNLMEEAAKMGKIEFRFILPIYGICRDPPALVMEYMINGSLDNVLCSQKLTWSKKFQIIHEVTMGMNFLHCMTPPLLHLDLKPGNILLDEYLHVKISDFGLSKWKEYSSRMELLDRSSVRGTVSYIPPEMFLENSRPPGTKTDVYSFAIVIWGILTQRIPYPGASIMTVIFKVVVGERPSLEDLPEDRPFECEQMIDLMERCWEQESKERPSFADIVKETEVLNEMIKSVDIAHGCNDEGKTHQLVYCKQSSSIKEAPQVEKEPVAKPGDGQSENFIISVLSKKDFDTFKTIVKKEDAFVIYEDNYTLLHYAVASGDFKTVKEVLQMGAVVNSQSINGYTPLITAALYRHFDVCCLLIEHKADVNLTDEDKWTPLHFAAQNGDDRIARLLLDNHATVNARERDGWTPLHLSCQNGHENVVRVLLPRHAEIDLQENENRTALHIAASYGHISIVTLLIKHRADLNKKQNENQTPLHLASEKGHFRVARLLVKSGADVNSLDNNNYTVLHMAALKGHNGICRHLLKHGGNTNLKTSQGWTPLHLASFRGRSATVRLLLENQAELNARGEKGWTPLHLATRYGKEEVITELLKANADPNIAEDSGWTPLHFSTQKGSLISVLQLIRSHAEINARNILGWTPLHLATLNGNVLIVQALLINKADKTIKDLSGCTAVQLAIRNKKESISELFTEDSVPDSDNNFSTILHQALDLPVNNPPNPQHQ